MSNLIEIFPENIANEKNIFLGLSLIRNDISDLIFLQGLHADYKKGLNLDGEISSKTGHVAGLELYIFRHALSLLYSSLEFLSYRSKDFETEEVFKNVFKRVSQSSRESWSEFVELSISFMRAKNISDIDGLPSFNKKTKRILKLCFFARNHLTYHHHGTVKYLGEGYKIAFEGEKIKNNKFAYVTEEGSIKEDRAYYIDLSLQRYLEEKIGSNNLLVENLSDFLNFMAEFNASISSILKEYHLSIVQEYNK